MAAGNGENFVTDNSDASDASGGGDERGGGGGGGKTVASSIVAASKLMVEGNANKMAAGNGENSATDNLGASGGGDELGGGGGGAVPNSILAASQLMVEGNAMEGLQMAVSGGEEFFSPEKKAGVEQMLKDEVVVVSTGQGSSADATTVVWGIGQRVKVLGKCDGLVLFIGEDPEGLWYGVALDEEKGESDGFAGGIRHFYCLPKYGVFVQSAKLQAANMSAADIVLKAMLGGAVVPENEVKRLSINQLWVYLKHKDVSRKVKSVWRKPDYITMALVAMGAVVPSATLVHVPEGKLDEGPAVALKEGGAKDAHDGETKSLIQPLNVHGQNELVSSTTSSPEQNKPKRVLPVVPVSSPTSSSATTPPPNLCLAQDGVATASLKRSGCLLTTAEGNYLEELADYVWGEVGNSVNVIVNADAAGTSKRFQMEGPIEKFRKILKEMELVYASIECSDASGCGESSVVSSVHDETAMPAKVANGAVPANTAKFMLSVPLVAPVSKNWSFFIPDPIPDPKVKNTVATVVGAQLFFPIVEPLVAPQPIFSASFASAARAVSVQPTTPAVGQEIGGTTQGRGVTGEVFGRIVSVFREHKYGFIRSEEGKNFFFGRTEYRQLMSVGDPVQFTYDPNRDLSGLCPIAVDIWRLQEGDVNSKGEKILGAQPAAMASTNSGKKPKQTYRDVTKRGGVGSSVSSTTTKSGAAATVTNVAVENGVKSDVDKRLDSMQSLLERMEKDSTAMKQWMDSLHSQKASVPS